MNGQVTSSGPDTAGRGFGVASWYTAGRTDGFGDRLLMFDNSGAASFELLRFRPDLAAEAGFEGMLRQRVQRLSTFRHPAFATIRAVEHLEDGNGLALVSNHTAGRRLSELLEGARTPAGLHPAFVSWLVQQITPLVSALQAHGYDIVHGALTVDRIILTPDGHITIVEHALGSALRGLEMSPSRLWREFGIVARPTSRGEACLDARGDIMQLGIVALSLLLGRRITLYEVQDQLPALLDEFSSLPGARTSLFAAPLRQWLERAMQAHPQAYRSAAEAQEGLRELPEQAASSLPTLLNSMMPGAPPLVPTSALPPAQSEEDEQVTAQPAAPHQSPPITAAVENPVVLDASPAALADVPAETFTVTTETPRILDLATLLPPEAADISRVDEHTLEVASMSDTRPAPFTMSASTDRTFVTAMRRWIILGLALIALAEAVVIGILALRRPAPAAAAAVVPLAVTVEGAQAGATVFVNDQPAGTTPLKVTLDSGTRSIRIGGDPASGTSATNLPTVVPSAAAAAAAQTARQRNGGVRFTAPIDLQVLEGTRVLGQASAGLLVLAPGTHQLELVNTELGFRTRQSVTIRPGENTTFTVTTPQGRLSLNAQPWAQVWVDQNAVGETPIANLSVAIGPHEITFRHPQLGERKETVLVRADGVTRLSTTFGR